VVRLTLGVTPGLSVRRLSLRREVTGLIRDSYAATARSTSFALVVDAGVLVGTSPGGVRFSAGAMMWLDLPGTVLTPSGDPRIVPFDTEQGAVDAPVPTPAYPVAAGPQLFIGPAFGVHWGR